MNEQRPRNRVNAKRKIQRWLFVMYSFPVITSPVEGHGALLLLSLMECVTRISRQSLSLMECVTRISRQSLSLMECVTRISRQLLWY